ncbi:hypothetical protein [Micromonospora sp. NPDC092111]|uniref:hypothetical protein n=1 Tax=Micromonospora sp. NPDC092111 TaxID=3364289 RepID=UPI00381DB3BC
MHRRPRPAGVPVRVAALRVGAERGQPDRLRATLGDPSVRRTHRGGRRLTPPPRHVTRWCPP